MSRNLLMLLDDLDLEPIMVKAIDDEEGLGWSLDFTKEVATEYKKFLALCILRPDAPIVPSTFVDDFWHLHILDTQKYAEDCAKFVGSFLHHFPYFGMRGDADRANLDNAWVGTLKLYRESFLEEPNSKIWPKSKRCPNCGKRSQNDATAETRPRLRDIVS